MVLVGIRSGGCKASWNYQESVDSRCCIFNTPVLALLQDKPRWLVYHELAFTTKEYMRSVSLRIFYPLLGCWREGLFICLWGSWRPRTNRAVYVGLCKALPRADSIRPMACLEASSDMLNYPRREACFARELVDLYCYR